MSKLAPMKMPKHMKMKELERVSGLGRETIRYYIREGLLPEPERPKRNVALYTDAHVTRLETIKRLQSERHLPLHLIKSLVLAEAENPVTGFEAFIGLENRLGPMLAERRALGPRLLEDVAQDAAVSMEDVRGLASMSFIAIERRDNTEWLNERNARLVELIGEWRAAGFTEEAGFPIEGFRIYVEVTQALAHRSVAQFYKNFGTKVTSEGAANMGVKGINLINAMMPLLRIEKIIREVERVSATGTFENEDED
ncbi:MAG: MerR family transcriptional regulator [Parvibaculaceae bacterium]